MSGVAASIVVGAVACAGLLAAPAWPAHAASAVAAASDMTYGYAFNQPTEEAAKAAALRSCGRRTRAACQIVVSCGGPGYGAISFRRVAGRGALALGASCGSPSVQEAYRTALESCNERGAGRCGHPRVGWNDRASAPPAEVVGDE